MLGTEDAAEKTKPHPSGDLLTGEVIAQLTVDGVEGEIWGAGTRAGTSPGLSQPVCFCWNLLVPFSKIQVDMAVGKYWVTFGPSAESALHCSTLIACLQPVLSEA